MWFMTALQLLEAASIFAHRNLMCCMLRAIAISIAGLLHIDLMGEAPHYLVKNQLYSYYVS